MNFLLSLNKTFFLIPNLSELSFYYKNKYGIKYIDDYFQYIINKNLNKLYVFSGYIAAFFLTLVAVFILIGISSRIFDKLILQVLDKYIIKN